VADYRIYLLVGFFVLVLFRYWLHRPVTSWSAHIWSTFLAYVIHFQFWFDWLTDSRAVLYPKSEHFSTIVVHVCQIHWQHDSMPVDKRAVTCSLQSSHTNTHHTMLKTNVWYIVITSYIQQ